MQLEYLQPNCEFCNERDEELANDLKLMAVQRGEIGARATIAATTSLRSSLLCATCRDLLRDGFLEVLRPAVLQLREMRKAHPGAGLQIDAYQATASPPMGIPEGS